MFKAITFDNLYTSYIRQLRAIGCITNPLTNLCPEKCFNMLVGILQIKDNTQITYVQNL